jgi:DNA-binding transcriptional LysR family regulator
MAALRHGEVDLALVFDYGDEADEPRNVTLHPVLREPLYLVTRRNDRTGRELADHAGGRWIAGCPRCRAHLLAACRRAGFTPRIEYETDDYVAVQALVAAGLGVSTLPGLALLANRHPDLRTTRLAGDHRRVSIATYGKPPFAAPTQALFDTLRKTITPPRWPRSRNPGSE